MRIVMIGSGYVGLVSGACFADFGHHVTCVDKSEPKIDALEAGKVPIFEPGLEGIIAHNRTRRAPGFFEGPRAFRCRSRRRVHRRRHAVPPRRRPCRPDLCLCRGRAISRAAVKGFTVVVTKSTVPVGTGDEIERIFRETNSRRRILPSSPIRNSCAKAPPSTDFKRPDRIVVGTEDDARRRGDARGLPPALPQSRRRSISASAAPPN